MTRVIVVANQKGGVGKTTTVVNLGAALAELGQQVLLIDLDPQAALTAGLGFDPYTLTRTTYTLLARDRAPLVSVLRPVGRGLSLAPASVDLASIEYKLAEAADRGYRLRGAIERNRLHFDFILIDTPPSLSVLTVNGLVAARELLIPVQCQFLSMRGVRSLLETVWLVHERMNPDLDLLGVLATMHRENSQHSREVVGELRAVFQNRVFQVVIGDDEAVAEAPAVRKPVLSYRPGGAAAAAYLQLAREISHAN